MPSKTSQFGIDARGTTRRVTGGDSNKSIEIGTRTCFVTFTLLQPNPFRMRVSILLTARDNTGLLLTRKSDTSETLDPLSSIASVNAPPTFTCANRAQPLLLSALALISVLTFSVQAHSSDVHAAGACSAAAGFSFPKVLLTGRWRAGSRHS